MHRSLKRNLAIGGAALAVAAGAGGAYAATQSSGPDSRQAFLNDVAKRLHVTPQQLNQALKGAFDDQLQAAVKSGRLTQAQADELRQRLQRSGAVPALPFFGFGGRLARPFLGPFPPGRFGFFGGPGDLPAAASYLGLTMPQLFQQLSAGKSLAQIATQNHKTVSGLEHAMTAAVKARLDKAVKAKLITSAQEQKLLARMSARIAKEVNQKGFPRAQRVFPPHLQQGIPPKGLPMPPKGVPIPPGGAIPPKGPPQGPAFVPPVGAPLPLSPVA